MKILWLTWKDRQHPLAGGAEVVNEELAKRLVADGHEVKLIVGGYTGCKQQETVNGYSVTRMGNRLTLYPKAWRYYSRHLRGWADLVIDEINTIPFMAKWYVAEPNLLFVHMLCREIWFYQMFFPLSLLGYLIEPIYLRLLADRKVVTVSNSSKEDLLRYGFKGQNIKIISEGIELTPISDLEHTKKYPQPTLLSLGAIRPMKRTYHQLKAFELAKTQIPELKFIIAGDSTGRYGQKLLKKVKASPYAADIKYLGKVGVAQKKQLLQKCHCIVVTSIKEGWGLVVTEAASQGTPAVAYNVDGLRDSIRNGYTGLLCETNTPTDLANKIVELLDDDRSYQTIRKQAWQESRQITFANGYRHFLDAIKKFTSS